MQLLMAANWKMFKTQTQATTTLRELTGKLNAMPDDRQAVIFAPFTALSAASEELKGANRIALGGQNCYPADEGAFTGEISPAMLLDCGCSFVLTGHSERRAIFQESDEFIGKKTALALEKGLKVILCVGETLEERDAGKLQSVLERQMEKGLADVLDNIAAENISIAYEPVWAIGTGRVAGAEEILEAHALVRSFLEKRFSRQGREIRILYGGSVKPENAGDIIRLDNVNGVLVGGASLLAESFSRIVLA